MKRFMEVIYPSRCVLCDATNNVSKNSCLCEGCESDILINTNPCQQCAVPVNVESGSGLCGECLSSPPSYDNSWSPFIYAQPLEWMIQQLKFNDKLFYATALSALMLKSIEKMQHKLSVPDVIIPMPLHVLRLRQRGFNQSSLLCKPIAKYFGCKLDLHSCRRKINTDHQTGKTAKQRQENIKGAFEFENKKSYQHVVIFDDVVTTGSTVNELCKVIKRAGVRKVDVWSLARAEKC